MNASIKAGCDKLNIPCIPSRLAILTRPLNGRPACHYAPSVGAPAASMPISIHREYTSSQR